MSRQQAYYTKGLTLPRTLTCGFVHHLPTCLETTMWFLKVFVKGSFITRHVFVLFFLHLSVICSLGLKNAIRMFKFQAFKHLKNKFSTLCVWTHSVWTFIFVIFVHVALRLSINLKSTPKIHLSLIHRRRQLAEGNICIHSWPQNPKSNCQECGSLLMNQRKRKEYTGINSREKKEERHYVMERMTSGLIRRLGKSPCVVA